MPLQDSPATYDPTAFGTNTPETLYLFTSLTSGSSSIITATSRLEHLLKSHKIPFKAVDVATDDKARSLWGRRSKGKRLPGVVKDGMVIGNYEDCEEWTEFGELKQMLGFSALPKPKGMDGTTSSPVPTTSAAPNKVSSPPPQPSTANAAASATAATAAQAAAAVGQQLKKTTGGVKAAVTSQEGGQKEEKTRGIEFAKDVQGGKEKEADKKPTEKKGSTSTEKSREPTLPEKVAESAAERLQGQERGEDISKRLAAANLGEDDPKSPTSTPKTGV